MSTGEMYYLIMAISGAIVFAITLAVCELEDRRRREGGKASAAAPHGAYPAE